MYLIRNNDYIVKAKKEDILAKSNSKLKIWNSLFGQYIKIEDETLIFRYEGVIYKIKFEDLIDIKKNKKNYVTIHEYRQRRGFYYTDRGIFYFLQIEYKKKGKFKVFEFIYAKEETKPLHMKREYIDEKEIDKVVNHFIRKNQKEENLFEINYITIRGGAEADEIEEIISNNSNWEKYDCSSKTIIIACIIGTILFIVMFCTLPILLKNKM